MGIITVTVMQWSLTSRLINCIQKYTQNFDRKLRNRNLISHFDICNMIYYYCSTWSRLTRFCRAAWLTRPDTIQYYTVLYWTIVSFNSDLNLNWAVTRTGTGHQHNYLAQAWSQSLVLIQLQCNDTTPPIITSHTKLNNRNSVPNILLYKVPWVYVSVCLSV